MYVVFVVAVVAHHEEWLEHHVLEYHPALHNHLLSSHVAATDLCTTLSH